MNNNLTHSQLIIKVDEVDTQTTYVGYAAPNSTTAVPVWRILKIIVSGSLTTILFADGNNKFDNIWDNRASLSYS